MNEQRTSPIGTQSWFWNNVWSVAGVFGLIFTLLSNVDNYLGAAKYAHYLVNQWSQVITAVWRYILFFLPHISSLDANLLTIAVLVTGTAIRSMKRSPIEIRPLNILAFVMILLLFGILFQKKLTDAYSQEINNATARTIKDMRAQAKNNLTELTKSENRIKEIITQRATNKDIKIVTDEYLSTSERLHRELDSDFSKIEQYKFGNPDISPGYFMYLKNMIANRISYLTHPRYLSRDENVKDLADGLNRIANHAKYLISEMEMWTLYDNIAIYLMLALFFAAIVLPFIAVWLISGCSPDVARMNKQLWTALTIVVTIVVISHVGEFIQKWVYQTGLPSPTDNLR